ncbi:type II toxin-antitoxin system VapC family toxin [Methylobacter sp. YRD-M1]|uniref:type II toxin-antitoxin system VapC family toxin n=1 Tax=Methylobacter sp. YRD-M1 TaxID=2911520 RepID=UPI00227B3A7F|nr:type II toxin-antitoxin system VapC family toxin [Methylobacter sp. YRD-M1]WAK03049.1 type II toxin-antitoxin system VapC family toxin [Methylobacter sp. YRD-M1]
MILVDTSVWIDHLRRKDAELAAMLSEGQVLVHPWIIGELACGNLQDRKLVLDLLQSLPSASVASTGEVLFFIEKHVLMGRGIGYVDVHLLAAARLAGTRLWTRDKRLVVVADELGMAYTETRH